MRRVQKASAEIKAVAAFLRKHLGGDYCVKVHGEFRDPLEPHDEGLHIYFGKDWKCNPGVQCWFDNGSLLAYSPVFAAPEYRHYDLADLGQLAADVEATGQIREGK